MAAWLADRCGSEPGGRAPGPRSWHGHRSARPRLRLLGSRPSPASQQIE